MCAWVFHAAETMSHLDPQISVKAFLLERVVEAHAVYQLLYAASAFYQPGPVMPLSLETVVQ